MKLFIDLELFSRLHAPFRMTESVNASLKNASTPGLEGSWVRSDCIDPGYCGFKWKCSLTDLITSRANFAKLRYGGGEQLLFVHLATVAGG